jgi:hypothetical protein
LMYIISDFISSSALSWQRIVSSMLHNELREIRKGNRFGRFVTRIFNKAGNRRQA